MPTAWSMPSLDTRARWRSAPTPTSGGRASKPYRRCGECNSKRFSRLGSFVGGEILVSQAVQEGLGGAFPLDRARSLSLKGLAGHHAAFPMLWQ